jgi:parallel beta-helix repeat protein
MNKKRLTASLLLMMLAASLAMANSPASGQSQQSLAPAVDWQKRPYGDGLTWVAEASDGGYVFFYPGYYSTSYGLYEEPATLTKVSSQGNLLWARNFSRPFPENFIAAGDGGYAYTALNGNTLTLSKLSSVGYSVWNQTFAGSFAGSQLLAATKDGGFLVAIRNDTGYVRVENEYVYISALMLFKADSQGRTQWTKILDSLNSSYKFRSLIQTSDGGYALGGTFGSSGGEYPLSPPVSNASDFCLAKISPAGDLQWTKTYGGANDDDANSFVQTSDGGYALVGNTRSFGAGSWDALLVKADASGNLVWARAYGGCPSAKFVDLNLNLTGEHDDYANVIVETNDGGLAFAGALQWQWPNSNNQAWLVATDANGNVKWNQAYNSVTHYYIGASDGANWEINALLQSRDGSFVMGGFAANGFHHWDKSSYLIKTKPAVLIPITSPTPSPMPSLAFPPITINADGTVTPSTAPLTRAGSEYKVTQDVHNPLIVKADNIVVDGQGHLINGNGTVGSLFVVKSQTGIELSSSKNVTVRNFDIENFKIGILLDASDNVTVMQNTLTLNNQGILAINSSNPVIKGNDFSSRYQQAIRLTCCLNSEVTNNKLTESGIGIDETNGNVIAHNDFKQAGIGLQSSNNTLISANTFYMGWVATGIFDSPNTIVAANNYTDCHIAVTDSGVPGNLFFMNGFVNSTYPPDLSGGATTNDGTPINIKDFWDNGTVGNYWSNYTQRYPNAKPAGTSGTWNTPYVVSLNNTDYHPLIAPIASDVAQAVSQALISTHTTSSPPSPTPTPIIPPTVFVLSPANKTYAAVYDPYIRIPLIFETNKTLSWVGYSLDGGENITVSENGTLIEIGVNSRSLTLYANDTTGIWQPPQTVYYEIAFNLGTPPIPTTFVIAIFLATAVGAVVVVIGLRIILKNKRKTAASAP